MREPYSITGLVHWVGELQTYAKGFTKRLLVIVDDPDQQYPNYAAIEFFKDKTQLLASLKEGEEVTAKFFPDAHYWEPKDKGKEGKWFSSLRGVDLAINGVNAQNLTERTDVDSIPDVATPPEQAGEEVVSDDLPF